MRFCARQIHIEGCLLASRDLPDNAGHIYAYDLGLVEAGWIMAWDPGRGAILFTHGTN